MFNKMFAVLNTDTDLYTEGEMGAVAREFVDSKRIWSLPSPLFFFSPAHS